MVFQVITRSSGAHRAMYMDSNACRACPPAPPVLNIPVKKYHWIQQCLACENTPSSSFVSTSQSACRQMTPLLGERLASSPKYSQYSPADRYPHVNTPDLMRPWSSEIPPLPPGAVIVADYYTTRSNLPGQWYPIPSEDSHRRGPSEKSRRRSRETSITRETSKKRHLTKERAKRDDDSTRESASSTSGSSYTSVCSECVSLRDTPVESEVRTVLDSDKRPESQARSTSSQLSLRYNYQPQESSSVYQKNLYLKSASEDSNSSSNTSRPTEALPPLTKGSIEKGSEPSTSQCSTVMSKESGSHTSSTSLKSKITEVCIVSARELTTSSPSSDSTASSDPELMDLANSADPRADSGTLTAEDESVF